MGKRSMAGAVMVETFMAFNGFMAIPDNQLDELTDQATTWRRTPCTSCFWTWLSLLRLACS